MGKRYLCYIFFICCGLALSSGIFALTPKEQKGVKTLKTNTIDYLSPDRFTPKQLSSAPTDITYRQSLLPPGDRSAELYIVMPTLGLISPVILVPEGSPDYIAMARGGEIDINRYLIDGVMHYPESAMPDEEGNIVIFGHSNFFKSGVGRYKTIFADIMNLDVGVDEIWLYQLTAEKTYERFVYAIEKSYETVPTDVGILEPKGGKELTVFACTNGLAGRWILRGRQLPDDEKNIPYEIKQRIDGLLQRFYVLTADQKQLIRDEILVAIEMKRIRTISPVSASSREIFDYLEKHLLQ